MPAGVSWGEYLRFAAAALGSMFLGSQAVHLVYRPLDDMDKVIDELKQVKQRQLAANEAQVKKEPVETVVVNVDKNLASSAELTSKADDIVAESTSAVEDRKDDNVAVVAS